MGCVESGSLDIPHSVRDSNGVRIVEYEGMVQAPTDIRLSDGPVLRLGNLEEGGPESFFRISDLALGPGHLFVADMSSEEVRIFSRGGHYLRTIGRDGHGPGEFTRLSMLHLIGGDTLLTYAGGTDRFSLFNLQGKLLNEFRTLKGIEGLAFPAAITGSGLILSLDVAASTQLPRSGEIVDSARVALFNLAGQREKTLGSMPFARRFVLSSGDRNSVGSVPFAPVSVFTGWHLGFCFSPSDSYVIRCFSEEGDLLMEVRWKRTLRPLTPEDISAYQALVMERVRPQRRAIERSMLEKTPYPASQPSYQSMISTPGGTLWVKEFRGPRDSKSTWHLFGPDGLYRGSFDMPKGFSLRSVTETTAAGIWKDELDVEHVWVFDLLH